MRRIALFASAAVVLTLVLASSGLAQQTPVYGGVMRWITSQTPQMLSYVPAMGPGDRTAIFPGSGSPCRYHKGTADGFGHRTRSGGESGGRPEEADDYLAHQKGCQIPRTDPSLTPK